MKAAEERDKKGDQFQKRDAEVTINPPKKRSALKRAFNKLLTRLHLRKKAEPMAPLINGNWEQVHPTLWRHVGNPQPSRGAQATAPHQPDRQAHFNILSQQGEWWTGTSDDDAVSRSSEQSGDTLLEATNSNGKDPERTGRAKKRKS